MISFFSIFFVLLAGNALLLFFSLKGASKSSNKVSKNSSNSIVPKLYPQQEPEVSYKKAV